MADIWSGLAYLLAELIEKHVHEINLEGLPLYRIENDKIVVNETEEKE